MNWKEQSLELKLDVRGLGVTKINGVDVSNKICHVVINSEVGDIPVLSVQLYRLDKNGEKFMDPTTGGPARRWVMGHLGEILEKIEQAERS